MADTFLTFKRFHDEEIANDLILKLRQLDIEFEVEDSDKFFDPSFAKNIANRDINIKLRPEDFPVAQRELENYYKSQTELTNPGYYLFEFTNEELQEIIEKPDEWGDFDYQLAQKILKTRGNEMSSETVSHLQQKRNDSLAEPEPYHRGWIYLGYLSAILGGLFGIIIGWYLHYSKKTLPDGRSVHTYREWERKQGKRILLLGCILLPVWIILKIMYRAENY